MEKWKVTVDCLVKLFGDSKIEVTTVSAKSIEEAKWKAEQKLKQKYKHTTIKKVVLLLNDNTTFPIWHLTYSCSATFFSKSINGNAEIRAENAEAAKEILTTYLKKNYKYVTIESVSTDEFQKMHDSGACCANCVYSTRQWPSIYCSRMTKRSFGEDYYVEVKGTGICDNYLPKASKSNSNYHD